MSNHTTFLMQALTLAQQQRGFCAPNPSVGAVIVSEAGEILATGYHEGAGHSHAEVVALNQLQGKAIGATLYLTLEPCCHWGRTPPCTDAIIQAGIRRVVYGFHDPNPLIKAKSKTILSAQSIQYDYHPLPEINEFYRSYFYWHQTKKPFVTAKIALSLDGKIAHSTGSPLSITGPEVKELTYLYRKQSDAILTTVKTIIHDDPQMNVRQKEIIAKPLYILDRELTLPLTATVLTTAKSLTLFHAKTVAAEHIEKYQQKNIRCIAIETQQNQLSLPSVIDHIGQDGVHDLWVEAGGTCFSAFAREKLVQKMLIYVAPRWVGLGLNAFDNDFSLNISDADVAWRQVGNDAVCEILYYKNKT